MSTEEKLLELVQKQGRAIQALQEELDALRPKEEPAPEVPNKPWRDMTPDEKVTYTGSKYSG